MRLSMIEKLIAIIVALTVGLSMISCSGGEIDEDVETSDKISIEIKSALELDPNNRRLRMLLGKYYVITEQYQKAVEDDGSGRDNWDDGFPYLLRRNRTDMEAAIALADVYLKWGDSIDNPEEKLEMYQEASIILDEQIENYNPDEAKLLFEKCRIYTRLYDNDSLYNTYFQASDMDPEFNRIEDYTAGELGEYFINTNRDTIAKGLLEQMSQNESREPKIHYELARYHFLTDRYESAQEDLIRAIEYSHPMSLDPAKPGKLQYASNELLSKINNDLGRITMLLSDDEDTEERENNMQIAKDHYKRAIDYDKSNLDAFVNLGDMYYSDLTQPNLTLKRNAAIMSYIKAASIIISFELSQNAKEMLNNIVDTAIQESGIIIPPGTTPIINDTIVQVLNQAGTNTNIPATEIFYKIGFLYYDSSLSYRDAIENDNLMNPTVRDLIFDVLGEELQSDELESVLEDEEVRTNLIQFIETKITEAEEIARNAFFISYSKGDQSYRQNPNINFALGNSYYFEGRYQNAVTHYNNMIDYLESYLENKYLSRDNSDPVKSRIHLELAWAYNNLGATQYMIFRNNSNSLYFDRAQQNFLTGQTCYIKYEPNISNPKTGNLRDLFEQQNLNLTSNQQSTYKPQIYEDIYLQPSDIIQ